MPTARRVARILDVLARRQPDLTVVAEDVYKSHNLSAMLRSCDAVGIGTVHAVRPSGDVPTYEASSASAEKWVDLRVHRLIDDAVFELRAAGMQVLAAHFGDEAVDYRSVDYVRPTAVLFGNERSGVSHRAAALADAQVIVPMLGMVQSLNVSVATAVILFEAQRQRREAGRYDRPALPARTRNDLALRWLDPGLARRHDEAGTPLPWIDVDGSVLPEERGVPAWASEPDVPS